MVVPAALGWAGPVERQEVVQAVQGAEYRHPVVGRGVREEAVGQKVRAAVAVGQKVRVVEAVGRVERGMVAVAYIGPGVLRRNQGRVGNVGVGMLAKNQQP